MNKDLGFPFFSVIYVNKPLMYVCEVYVNDKRILTAIFDVKLSPDFGKLIHHMYYM